MYSNKLAEALKKYLDSICFDYDFYEDTGCISFCAKGGSKIKNIGFVIEIEENSYKICALLKDLNVNKNNIWEITSYMHKINREHPACRFEMSFYDMEVVCILKVICKNTVPDNNFIGESFANIFYCISKYGDELVNVA